MTTESRSAVRRARRALSGTGSHAETKEVFSGLDWKAAGTRLRGVTHSAYQILAHMAYWQDWVVAWLEGERPAVPRHASGSWPAEVRPPSQRDWEEAVARYRRGLGILERACRGVGVSPKRSAGKRLEMLHTIAAHNSYHAGQVAFLRQQLGKWPPPSGGVTW